MSTPPTGYTAYTPHGVTLYLYFTSIDKTKHLLKSNIWSVPTFVVNVLLTLIVRYNLNSCWFCLNCCCCWLSLFFARLSVVFFVCEQILLNSTQLSEHVRTQVLTPQCPHLFNTTTYILEHIISWANFGVRFPNFSITEDCWHAITCINK